MKQCKNVKDSVGKIGDTKVCFFSIPQQFELSLIPSVARCFSMLISQNKLKEIQVLSIEKIIEGV
jgi:hypothetical protein